MRKQWSNVHLSIMTDFLNQVKCTDYIIDVCDGGTDCTRMLPNLVFRGSRKLN